MVSENDASDKIWLQLAHWLLRYSCLKVLTDARTDARTDGRRLDSHPISSPVLTEASDQKESGLESEFLH